MAFSPVSGIAGAVLIGSVTYAFGKWQFAMKTGTPKVTNFTGGGYRQLVAGVTEGTITCDGPYDHGNMAFTSGTSYTVILQWTTMVTLTGTAILASIESTDDVEDAGRVKLVFEVNGAFSAEIV